MQFTQSSIQAIMGKLSGVQMNIAGGDGMMDVNGFRDTLRGASQGRLNEHEIMTIARFYQVSYFTCEYFHDLLINTCLKWK